MTYLLAIFFISITVAIYQAFSVWQKSHGKVLFNPMILSISLIIPILLLGDYTFEQYKQSTLLLHQLLDIAIVALGFPLYQQFDQIKKHWKVLFLLLTLGAIIVITISFFITVWLLHTEEMAISLALKSITTPIALALIDDIGGSASISAFAIIIAGVFGAMVGPKWLVFCKVTSPASQGLAIGAASHAIGTSTITKISFEHGAYGSLALIVSAIITALLSPILIPFMISLSAV